MKRTKTGINWLTRIAACVSAGSVLMVAFICLFVNFGFNTVIGREAVYLSALLLIGNVLLLHRRERRLVREQFFPSMSRGMYRYRLTANGIWLFGVLLLAVSGVLLLCGVSMAEFWSDFTVIGGYILLILGWLGNLSVYHHRHMAAAAVAQEKVSV